LNKETNIGSHKENSTEELSDPQKQTMIEELPEKTLGLKKLQKKSKV